MKKTIDVIDLKIRLEKNDGQLTLKQISAGSLSILDTIKVLNAAIGMELGRVNSEAPKPPRVKKQIEKSKRIREKQNK